MTEWERFAGTDIRHLWADYAANMGATQEEFERGLDILSDPMDSEYYEEEGFGSLLRAVR